MTAILKILSSAITLIEFLIEKVKEQQRVKEQKSVDAFKVEVEKEVKENDVDALNDKLGWKKP